VTQYLNTKFFLPAVPDDDLKQAQQGWKSDLPIEGSAKPFKLCPAHPRFPQWIAYLRQRPQTRRIFAGADPDGKVQILLQPMLRKGPRSFPSGKRANVVRVLFDASPAAFTVHRENPHFKRILAMLDSNKDVMVAAHPTTLEILDVEYSRPGTVTAQAVDLATPKLSEICRPAGLSRRDINHAFQIVNEASNIPFRAISSCCSARAHEMCRIMISCGLKPCKVWNYGHGAINEETTLQVQTPLVPAGFVKWLYHVAPVLLSNDPNDIRAYYVIDPSLFSYPVAIDEWRRIQQDAQSTSRITGPRFYYESVDKRKQSFDDDYVKTQSMLSTIGNNLSLAG
jgi:hypothetical protein